jgi:hypothetical protein
LLKGNRMTTLSLFFFTAISLAATDNTAAQQPNLSPPASTDSTSGQATAQSDMPLRHTIPSNPNTAMQRSTATEIVFQADTSQLTPESQAKLDALIVDAHKRGQIDQVKVLSWGDISYPPTGGARAPKGQKDLAKNRNEAIESYIERKNASLYVESYNMAERPSALQDLLNTSEARVKSSLEKSGISRDTTRRGSRAMVMVIVR